MTRSRFGRRALSGIAAGAALAIALTGCSLVTVLSGETEREEETNTATGESVAPELERFYAQSLHWSWRGSIGETTVTVPLDWSRPEGETIRIAVSRSAPTGESRGSLLINPGGPGGSGYPYGLYAGGVTAGVADSFDIIGFDPRGIGLSTPVVCYDDPADQDERLFGTFEAPYGTPEWVAELTERELDWIAACQENTGELLGHLDAVSVARDMDVIRAVLGDEQLNFLGYSYGSYLGTVYAELFPDKVGRMVLDGAVDPNVGDLEMLATQMAGFDNALRAFLAHCIAEWGDCPFRGSTADAMAEVREILEGIDARRLIADDGRVLDSATLGTAIASTLYGEWGWYGLAEVFRGLARGDAEAAFHEADNYYSRYNGHYTGNGNEVYVAVICNEGDLAHDGVDTLDGLDVLEERAPVLGRFLGYDDYALLDVACSNWPYPVAELPSSFRAEGARPILVIGTTNDPATPYEQAVTLAAELDSGVLISYEGEGHTIYAQGVACIDDAVERYLLEDVVPDADPRC